MSVTYPLFVFAKDDRSMRVIETPDGILSWHEAIDIENGEYVFWEATGSGVQIEVAGKEVMSVTPCAAPFPLDEALATYAESLNLPSNVIEGRPWRYGRELKESLNVGRRNEAGFLEYSQGSSLS